ncbi:hypothetical protein [Dechloromonas sp. CZR5]|uniref:hypothetical protein n=1 Tax=Dechloromonas sp. CZR5 TaxID=2608630 RepID=UPI00123DCB17|nr:hypothetical protein [Dechloromonas sp. CZR5]
MKERPILFSGPMVRAILAGRKTQTRRVAIKTSQPDNVYITDFDAEQSMIEIENKHLGARYWKQCPYGQPGDRLWVRENGWERPERTAKMMREGADTWPQYTYAADNWSNQDRADFKAWGFRNRPSIHMPRWASRILLEIVDIRIEKLQDISEADAEAEGPPKNFNLWRDNFCALWQQINGGGSWDTNPWVWVVEFKRLQGINP